jgi:hypothetical protein
MPRPLHGGGEKWEVLNQLSSLIKDKGLENGKAKLLSARIEFALNAESDQTDLTKRVRFAKVTGG